MNKESLYDNHLNYTKEVDSIIRSKIYEIWVPLIWNDIILNRYRISNYGRLYDLERRSLVDYSIDKDGYFMASITVPSYGYKKIRVHRFEYLSFYYNENYMNLQVNHKDGNKQNLFIGNLEWMTPIANTRHGWDNGLNNNIGINNGNGKYPEEMIHRICQYLDDNYTQAQICDLFNVHEKKERIRLSATISGIKLGKTHRYISSGYKFLNGIDKSARYSLEFAELVCQILSDTTRDFTYKEIMDMLDIPNNERVLFKVYINDLIRGRTALSVTSKYNLRKPLEGKDPNTYLMR